LPVIRTDERPDVKPAIERLEQRQLLAGTGPRATIDLNTDWSFNRGPVAGAEAATFNDAAWQPVSLPHTYNAIDGADGGANYYQGDAWYRRDLSIGTKLKSKRLILQFDAASLRADVYVNGTLAGSHVGGYSAFAVDVTGFVKFGKTNTIAVKVNNAIADDLSPTAGDYTKFGGLTRGVRLLAVPRTYIDALDDGSNGVYLQPHDVSSQSAGLRVETVLRNRNGGATPVKLRTTLYDADGNYVGSASRSVTLKARRNKHIYQEIVVSDPRLWNGKADPYEYTARVELYDAAGNFIDLVRDNVGFRTFAIDNTQGFLLNGKPYPLYGVGIHQDRQGVGPDTTAAQKREDVETLKELGVTAVRLSHYQHDQYTLDLLDQAGIVVWAEVPVTNDFQDNPEFEASVEQQLRELVKQQYNHPSIAVWGLFNEIRDTTATREFYTAMDAMVNALDPTRLTTAASDTVNPSAALNWIPDAAGFNRYFGWYYGNAGQLGDWVDTTRAGNGNRTFAISEFGFGGSIAQQTDNPVKPTATGGAFHPEQYQAIAHEQAWASIAKKTWMWGRFVWNLFDFASDGRDEGGIRGVNNKGLITYDHKTRKDAFYYYKAQWSSQPVLYLTGKRFVNRGSDGVTNVKVYANTDSVTLVLNGQTIGTKTSNNGVFQFDNVNLAPGVNRVVVSGTRGGQTYTDSANWTVGGNGSAPAGLTSRRAASATPTFWSATPIGDDLLTTPAIGPLL
jgi:beta-galactosidase